MSGTSRLRKLHMNEGTDLIAKYAVVNTHLKAKTPSSTVTTRCLYDTAPYSLIEELDNDFMFNKKALLLSTLVQRYKVLLPADIDGKNYKSPRLQSLLEKDHGSEVSFLVQHGQGQSTVVLCSTITVGAATHAAGSLKQELNLAGDLTDVYDESVYLEQAIL
ncbi:hypothetical protein LSAT2_007131, partial [Lamellibrachia satsuma]